MPAPRKDEPRSETLRFRVTPAEKATIGRHAKAADQVTGDYLRSLGLAGSLSTPSIEVGKTEPGVVDMWTAAAPVEEIVHLAGPLVTFDNVSRQRCVWCGALIEERDLPCSCRARARRNPLLG